MSSELEWRWECPFCYMHHLTDKTSCGRCGCGIPCGQGKATKFVKISFNPGCRTDEMFRCDACGIPNPAHDGVCCKLCAALRTICSRTEVFSTDGSGFQKNSKNDIECHQTVPAETLISSTCTVDCSSNMDSRNTVATVDVECQTDEKESSIETVKPEILPQRELDKDAAKDENQHGSDTDTAPTTPDTVHLNHKKNQNFTTEFQPSYNFLERSQSLPTFSVSSEKSSTTTQSRAFTHVFNNAVNNGFGKRRKIDTPVPDQNVKTDSKDRNDADSNSSSLVQESNPISDQQAGRTFSALNALNTYPSNRDSSDETNFEQVTMDKTNQTQKSTGDVLCVKNVSVNDSASVVSIPDNKENYSVQINYQQNTELQCDTEINAMETEVQLPPISPAQEVLPMWAITPEVVSPAVPNTMQTQPFFNFNQEQNVFIEEINTDSCAQSTNSNHAIVVQSQVLQHFSNLPICSYEDHTASGGGFNFVESSSNVAVGNNLFQQAIQNFVQPSPSVMNNFNIPHPNYNTAAHPWHTVQPCSSGLFVNGGGFASQIPVFPGCTPHGPQTQNQPVGLFPPIHTQVSRFGQVGNPTFNPPISSVYPGLPMPNFPSPCHTNQSAFSGACRVSGDNNSITVNGGVGSGFVGVKGNNNIVAIDSNVGNRLIGISGDNNVINITCPNPPIQPNPFESGRNWISGQGRSPPTYMQGRRIMFGRRRRKH